MRLLIAVVTCHRNGDAVRAILDTWAKDSPIDVRFFVGNPKHQSMKGGTVLTGPEIIPLDVPDTYVGLVEKVKAMIGWAYQAGYDALLKCDDDAYVVPSRLDFSPDHAGLWSPPVPNKSGFGPDCSTGYIHGGCGYVLSRRSMEILKDSPITSLSEDWWVTDTLNRKGIMSVDRPTHTYHRRVLRDPFPELPTSTNKLAVVAEFMPEELRKVHQQFLYSDAFVFERMSADEYKRYLHEVRVRRGQCPLSTS